MKRPPLKLVCIVLTLSDIPNADLNIRNLDKPDCSASSLVESFLSISTAARSQVLISERSPSSSGEADA